MRYLSKIVKFHDVSMDGCYQYSALPPVFSTANADRREYGTSPLTPLAGESETIIEQAKNESRDMVAGARIVAKKIKAYSVQKAQEEYRDAEKAGYEAGYREGKAQAERENAEMIEELTNLLQSIDSQKAEMINQYDNQLKDLALHIAKKIVEETLTKDDAAFLRLFEKAVEGFHGQKWVKLIVSDYDVQFATTNVQQLLSLVKGAEHIDIAVQKGAPKGTCIVETPQGTADASVNTQFQKLEKVLVAASVQE